MTIFDIVRTLGLDPKRVGSINGGEYASPCPMCGGDDRFHIWPEKRTKIGQGTWWCRGCKEKGDSVDLLEKAKNMSFKDACEYIGHKLEPRARYSAPPVKTKPEIPPPRISSDPPELWQEKATAFIETSKTNLKDNKEVLNYLLERRGIDEFTAEGMSLGWNPKDKFIKRPEWGLEKKEGDKDLYFPQGLVIPCFKNGKVVRVRFRKAKLRDKDDARYIILAGGSMTPFMFLQGKIGAVIIVESELDAMLIAQDAGDIISVISMGNAQARPDQAAAKVLKASPYIMNALDFDEAGAKVRERWEAEYPDITRWMVPDGKDPGEYFYKYNGDVRDWIRAGLPPRFESAI